MSDDIEPALTAEEWATALGPDYNITEGGDGRWALAESHLSAGTSNYHAIAALSLYGQRFGFTQEDVEAAQGAAHRAESRHDASRELVDYEEQRLFESLARRIAALLPPDKVAQNDSSS